MGLERGPLQPFLEPRRRLTVISACLRVASFYPRCDEPKRRTGAATGNPQLLAGGLDGLQTAAILSAAPFVLVMIGLCWSLLKALRTEQVPGVTPGAEAPEPGRAMSRPRGVSAPQQMAREDPE